MALRVAAFVVSLIALLAFTSIGRAREEPYAISYFGEPLRSISPEQLAQTERGYDVFVRNWPNQASPHNATSCMTCHSVPMPGGSGMSDQALVSVREREGRTEIIQRLGPERQPLSAHAGVRRTPPLFGMGFLEYAKRREREDGSLRPVFGARQEFDSLESFVEMAFALELGVPSASWCAQHAPAECTPRLSESELSDVVAYIRYLAPPPRRVGRDDRGANIFAQAGCASCHTPLVETGSRAPTALRNMSVYAYSDLSRHDLGSGLVRTTPLWGVNSTGPPYLHDGSALSLTEAIDRHAGEGADSRLRWSALSDTDRAALIAYLRSL